MRTTRSRTPEPPPSPLAAEEPTAEVTQDQTTLGAEDPSGEVETTPSAAPEITLAAARRHRRLVRRLLVIVAAAPVFSAGILGLVVVTAASTAPERTVTAEELAALQANTTVPETTVPATEPPATEPPVTAPPATDPPVTEPSTPPTTEQTPVPPPATVTLSITFDEPPCEGLASATGCAYWWAEFSADDGSGGVPVELSKVEGPQNARHFDLTLPVRSAASTWNLTSFLSYAGPCGRTPQANVVRYRIVVGADGAVELTTMDSEGSIQRPETLGGAWPVQLYPYRFSAPEPGC